MVYLEFSFSRLFFKRAWGFWPSQKRFVIRAVFFKLLMQPFSPQRGFFISGRGQIAIRAFRITGVSTTKIPQRTYSKHPFPCKITQPFILLPKLIVEQPCLRALGVSLAQKFIKGLGLGRRISYRHTAPAVLNIRAVPHVLVIIFRCSLIL